MLFIFNRLVSFALLGFLVFISGYAHAATQGSLGTSSTGIANISITKAVQARISDISDMTLGSWSVADGAVQLTSNVCIYSSTGSYRLTATGSGLANIFTLTSNGNLLPYSVAWNAGGAGALASTGTALLAGIQSSTFANADQASSTCSGGGSANDTARVVVNVSALAMELAIGSTTPYTGTLTMLVTPY